MPSRSFTQIGNLDMSKDRALKTRFKGLLLNPDYGLWVYIVKTAYSPYIYIRPDNASVSNFFDEIYQYYD